MNNSERCGPYLDGLLYVCQWFYCHPAAQQAVLLRACNIGVAMIRASETRGMVTKAIEVARTSRMFVLELEKVDLLHRLAEEMTKTQQQPKAKGTGKRASVETESSKGTASSPKRQHSEAADGQADTTTKKGHTTQDTCKNGHNDMGHYDQFEAKDVMETRFVPTSNPPADNPPADNNDRLHNLREHVKIVKEEHKKVQQEHKTGQRTRRCRVERWA